MHHGGRVSFVTIALAVAGCGEGVVPDPYRVATFEGEADSVSCLPAGDGLLVVASEASIGGSGRVSLFDTESYEFTQLAGPSARFIALAGDFLIAGNRPGALGTVPLFRVPLAGGELERIPGNEGVWSLATDGGAYFWHERGGAGGIYRFDPGDESLALLHATDEIRGDMVVADGWLYWAERHGVSRMPTSGGPPEILLDHTSEPMEMQRPIAVDDAYVYVGFDSLTNTRLVAVPLAGGAAVDVASLLPRLPTAVAARGVHVDGVELVVHIDPPVEHKAYLHRSGRTARAGEAGMAVSLVLWNQELEVRRLQNRLNLKQPIVEMFSNDARLADLAGFEPAEEPSTV